MKCAGDHASEFNGFAQLVRVYPDLPVLAPPDENDDQEQTNDDAPARPPQGPRQGGDPKSKAGLKPPP